MTEEEKDNWKNRVIETENEVRYVKSTLDDIILPTLARYGDKLDKIIEVINKTEAQPRVDWLKIVTTMCMCISAGAVTLGGMVYLMNLLFAKETEINRVLILKNYEISQINEKYLSERMNALEDKYKRIDLYNQPRSNNSIHLFRSGNRW